MRVGLVEEEGGTAGELHDRAEWVYQSVLVAVNTVLEASEVVEGGQTSLEPLSLLLSLTPLSLSICSLRWSRLPRGSPASPRYASPLPPHSLERTDPSLLLQQMTLPLPNEILSQIFIHLNLSSLRSVFQASRGLAHVARPFLYTSLVLPFRTGRGVGTVLDPIAYARFKVVTDSPDQSHLKHAVKSVTLKGSGEWSERKEEAEKLEWTPERVLEALVSSCPRLKSLVVEDPQVQDVFDAIGRLLSLIHI